MSSSLRTTEDEGDLSKGEYFGAGGIGWFGRDIAEGEEHHQAKDLCEAARR